jgi:hypothetical protein
MELSKHDSRLIAASIAYLLAITGSGDEGAVAMNLIKNRNSRNAIFDATRLLAVSKEGMIGNEEVVEDGNTFADNLERLGEIGKGLLRAEEVTAEVSVMEPISTDGTGIGPKQYQLWLTHDQIHLIHHAVMFAESGLSGDGVGLADAAIIYAELREKEYDAFVNKFNQAHEVARQDSGESS